MSQEAKKFYCKCGADFDSLPELGRHVHDNCVREKGKHGRVKHPPVPQAQSNTITRQEELSSLLKQMDTVPQSQTGAVVPPQPLQVTKLRNITWWKVGLGGLFSIAGLAGFIGYATSLSFAWAALAVGGIIPAAWFLYSGFFKRKVSGYQFIMPGKQPYTGKENTILINAAWDDFNKVAVPESIDFVYLGPEELPVGARPHYLRNIGKHFYELYNFIDPEKGEAVNTRKYVPVVMPDKKLCTPEAFVFTSNMQPVKDYMSYNPGTSIQKVATGVIIILILIVGILMTMTSSNPAQAVGG